MTAQEAMLQNQVTLDGTGSGSCYIVIASASTVFAPRLAIVSTTTSVKIPSCVVYRGSSQAPVSVLDNTFTGNGDSSGKVGGTLYYTGQAIWAVWSNGDPGSQAVLQVYGKTGNQTDNLQPDSVGSSFNASSMSPGQVAAGLINSTLSTVIATAIQAAGIPAIDKPTPVAVVFNTAIAPGATYVSNRISISSYQSIVGTMFAQEQAGGGLGTNPYLRMSFAWSLVADNYDPIVREDWVGGVGPFSFVNNYRHEYMAPCYGDTLTISITNLDSKAINFTYGLFGSYRTRIRSVMRARYPDDYSNEANGLGTDNVLLSASVGPIATGNGSAPQIVSLWEGTVQVSAQLSNGPANGTCTIIIEPQPSSLLNNSLLIPNVGNSVPATNIVLPRRVCTMKFVNFSGANESAVILIIGQNQPA